MSARRGFLKAGLAGAAAAAVGGAPATAPAADAAVPAPAGWQFLRPSEVAFVEALADHMVPADALSPSGTAIGIPVYIDRALAGGWGQGEGLYLQGPFQAGSPNQGYQLPLTPAQLFRAGTEAVQAHCLQAHGAPFETLQPPAREALLLGLIAGRIELAVPAATYFGQLHQLVTEGLFADPIYGGNRDKAGWKLVGFPGVVQTHRKHIVEFRNRPFEARPLSMADLA